jgi:hypothetical protein
MVRSYEILASQEEKLGGKRRLSECDGRMKWPERDGVYFFFERGENRSTPGVCLSVARWRRDKTTRCPPGARVLGRRERSVGSHVVLMAKL